MNSNDIENLYRMVREKKDINVLELITKDFILNLLDAPEKCLLDDLEALRFLLEVRTTLLCANKVTIGNVCKINFHGIRESEGGICDLEPIV